MSWEAKSTATLQLTWPTRGEEAQGFRYEARDYRDPKGYIDIDEDI